MIKELETFLKALATIDDKDYVQRTVIEPTKVGAYKKVILEVHNISDRKTTSVSGIYPMVTEENKAEAYEKLTIKLIAKMIKHETI